MATLIDKDRKPKSPAAGKPMAKSVAGGVLGRPAVKKTEGASGVSELANASKAASRRDAVVAAAAPRARGVADAHGEYRFKSGPKAAKTGDGKRVVAPAPALDAMVGGRSRDAVREPASLFDRMGHLLDQSLRSESDIVRIVDAGLPPAAFTALTHRLAIGHDLIAPESTVRRRLQDNQRFTTDESERMVRIARVHALAVELFGDEAAAQAWLNAPAQYVPGAAAVSPYRLSVTDAGARLVEDMLLRTAHGVF